MLASAPQHNFFLFCHSSFGWNDKTPKEALNKPKKSARGESVEP
jgi:hypothetical protein